MESLSPLQKQQTSRPAQFFSVISVPFLPPIKTVLQEVIITAGKGHTERLMWKTDSAFIRRTSWSNLQPTVGILWIIGLFWDNPSSWWYPDRCWWKRWCDDGVPGLSHCLYRFPSESREAGEWMDGIYLIWEIRARRWARKIVIIRLCAVSICSAIDPVTSGKFTTGLAPVLCKRVNGWICQTAIRTKTM